ncbi:uncharacterized protein [Haliotis asinina]|uniref:uncharacterized protein isoform X1 n=1 Tax=Haliotis asinina TaxID=109174 RepID=UPI003531F28E
MAEVSRVFDGNSFANMQTFSTRNLKKYLGVQIFVAIFVLYLWYQLNGGLIPSFLRPRLPFLQVGPDVHVLMFFGDAEDDGSKIKWARAVNTKAKLDAAVKGSVHMVEGDVILRGQGTKVQSLIPVMGKPPQTDSDVTLTEWLDALKYGNKGIKLDFTSIDSVEISLEKLKQMNEKKTIEFPVWLHADVLQGPHGGKAAVVATRFFKTVKRVFPKCTLSLGWTSGTHTDLSQSGYTWEMVMTMRDLVKSWDVDDQPIVFQARLSLIRNSVPQLKWLIDVVPHSALMIWHSPEDVKVSEDLMYVCYRFAPNMVFFDLNEDYLQSHLKQYRHFSGERVNDLVKKRDEVMFHPGAWVKMGFWREQESILPSTEALVLVSPIVYVLSKSKYKPTPTIKLSGRVQFINREGKEAESGRTGLDIFVRPTAYADFENIVGIKCFLGVTGEIEVSGSNLKKEFRKKSQKITPSSVNCFRFSVIDAVHEIIFRVNILHECNTLESVKPDTEVHAELHIDIPSTLGVDEHPFIIKLDDSKRVAVIDELNIKQT